MDFDNTQMPGNTGQPQPTPPQPPQTPPVTPNIPDFSSSAYNPYPPKKKGSGWKVFWGIVITLSLLANIVMFIGIIGIIAMKPIIPTSTSGSFDDNLRERVLVSGSRHKKIAVVNITGAINDQTSEWVRMQIKRCEKDSSIRGLIVRVNSPGGAVSSSDQIHHAITKYKEHTHKPVLCFMQGVAASGGYYSAVACDEIMAEQTTITGSIGVIMNFMVVKELLEEKLGIDPVTIKSGPHKDWPSMYSEATDEQKAYLHDKIITPSYERFVELVAEGRKDVLTEPEIRKLADGSIYSAPEAKENGLIDSIGYLEDAVDRIRQMANASNAEVVEYEQVFSVWDVFGAETKAKAQFNLESELLDKIAAPRVLYLWDGRE